MTELPKALSDKLDVEAINEMRKVSDACCFVPTNPPTSSHSSYIHGANWMYTEAVVPLLEALEEIKRPPERDMVSCAAHAMGAIRIAKEAIEAVKGTPDAQASGESSGAKT